MENIDRYVKKTTIRTFRDLNVYRQSYQLAMEIFEITKNIPREELYSLSDQARRSARSIPSNICEGWAKRKYKNIFLRHLIDATGSCEEMKVWLDFARDCRYISVEKQESLSRNYGAVGAMLHALIKRWENF